MNYSSINQFLTKIGELKHLDRSGWVLRKIKKPETVSGHMYRMAIMAMLLFDDKDINVDQVVKMALIHDIGECIVGDITPYDPVTANEKFELEMNAVKELGSLLPPNMNDRLKNLFIEYEKRETKESKLTKELDVFDAVLQAYEYEKKDVELKNELTIDMDHFFIKSYLDKIEHPILKNLLDQLLKERSEFLSRINNNIIKFDSNSSSSQSSE